MPTRKEAEEYKRRMEKLLEAIATWNTQNPEKDKILNELLDKWEATKDSLLGLGIPLEDEEED